jgi:hypothetical protein
MNRVLPLRDVLLVFTEFPFAIISGAACAYSTGATGLFGTEIGAAFFHKGGEGFAGGHLWH